MAKKIEKPVKKKKIVRKVDMFIRGIPEHIRDGFKAYCVRRKLTMKDRLIELMRDDCQQDTETMKKVKKVYKDTTSSIEDEDDED